MRSCTIWRISLSVCCVFNVVGGLRFFLFRGVGGGHIKRTTNIPARNRVGRPGSDCRASLQSSAHPTRQPRRHRRRLRRCHHRGRRRRRQRRHPLSWPASARTIRFKWCVCGLLCVFRACFVFLIECGAKRCACVFVYVWGTRLFAVSVRHSGQKWRNGTDTNPVAWRVLWYVCAHTDGTTETCGWVVVFRLWRCLCGCMRWCVRLVWVWFVFDIYLVGFFGWMRAREMGRMEKWKI